MGERLNQMRRAASNPPPKKPTVARPAVPPKPKKPGDIGTLREVVVHSCGHPRPVAQLLAQPCPQCTTKARREKNTRQKQRYEERRRVLFPNNGRLPDGSEFRFAPYDAATQSWSGSLTIPNVGTFTGSVSGPGSGIFALLKQLDQQYRAHLEDQAKANSGGTDGVAR